MLCVNLYPGDIVPLLLFVMGKGHCFCIGSYPLRSYISFSRVGGPFRTSSFDDPDLILFRADLQVRSLR